MCAHRATSSSALSVCVPAAAAAAAAAAALHRRHAEDENASVGNPSLWMFECILKAAPAGLQSL